MKTVLVVDDDSDGSRLFFECRERAGREPLAVEYFSTPKAALTRLQENPKADLIVLDHRLGFETGTDFLDRFARYAPVLYWSGVGDEELGADAVSQGASSYLSKKNIIVNPTRAYDRVDNAIGLSVKRL